MNIEINLKAFLDIINLKFGVYNPLNKFCSESDFISIAENYYLNNNNFFPFPIFINFNDRQYKDIKKKDSLNLYYNKRRICTLCINSYYKLNKEKYIKKIYSTNNVAHPSIQNFLKSGDYFVDGVIKDFNFSIINKINFSTPDKIKILIKRKKLKTIAGFHTRNAPHKAHEWIHKFALEQCDGLIIHPMIGQYESGEYKEKNIIQSNKKLIKLYNNKKIIFAVFNSYPRYAGPREALLHSIVRRNYGCTHFLVGRDHAGFKNFYSKYQSQNLCKKYKKYLSINIITFEEPFLCSNCKIIINKKCYKCNKISKIFISGNKIRDKILHGKKISKDFMRKEISSTLGKKSII